MEALLISKDLKLSIVTVEPGTSSVRKVVLSASPFRLRLAYAPLSPEPSQIREFRRISSPVAPIYQEIP